MDSVRWVVEWYPAAMFLDVFSGFGLLLNGFCMLRDASVMEVVLVGVLFGVSC